ncbi:MAG: transcription elongation factor GreA [Caulobacteraceae bacterium]|nr:transcription elongation factor GreA [Caulobacteraceae bacterium]
MSVAFTREEDLEAAAADLPDRPVSAHRNLVTADGLAQLDAALARARAAYGAAKSGDINADRTAMARATRDLRYYAARRASAELTPVDPRRPDVQFGSRVGIAREDGRGQTFTIVGEDEADPSRGLISYVSPLARALLGKEAGEVAVVAGAEIEITAVG